MLKDNKANAKKNIIQMFQEVNTSDFPSFDKYKRPLERALWVLWVAKEKLGIKTLTAEQITTIIVDVKEISIDVKSITNSFNRAGDKIHTHQKGSNVYYEIMKPGKEFLTSQVKEGSIQVFYFEPDRKYSSKRLLTKKILHSLNGDLRIVDPYCGERTLDILETLKDRAIKFLTRVEKLRDRERNKFLRELQDFKTEHQHIEFRNYPNADIHDRYIISSDSLVIMGHSIKDLGSKESFAIVLDKATSANIVEALSETFNRRWTQSSTL